MDLFLLCELIHVYYYFKYVPFYLSCFLVECNICICVENYICRALHVLYDLLFVW